MIIQNRHAKKLQKYKQNFEFHTPNFERKLGISSVEHKMFRIKTRNVELKVERDFECKQSSNYKRENRKQCAIS